MHKFTTRKPVSWILWILKWIAWILELIPFSGMKKRPTFDEICKAAEKSSGLNCFGDHPLWRQSFNTYVDDIYEHQDTNHIHRMTIRTVLTEQFVKRLRVLNAFKEYPQALELNLPRPIFVVGLARTGSTILHQCKLLKNHFVWIQQ